jgi:hypothetical protein
MNEKTKLERMEFAIANYNAMIRSLKKQMQAGTVVLGQSGEPSLDTNEGATTSTHSLDWSGSPKAHNLTEL